MRSMLTTAAGGLILAALLAAQPAQAQFGAIAYDGKTGCWSMSLNKPTPQAALTSALRECGASGCRVVIRLRPRVCGAVASSGKPRGFGASARSSLEEARRAALADCNKANAGECVVKASSCNR
ncbi:MAG TPA: DUF4189 domain-containing protein [Stellaceae bacterium]|nr:DUF4189 domain-containing protein [Stellaceae bacterium]